MGKLSHVGVMVLTSRIKRGSLLLHLKVLSLSLTNHDQQAKIMSVVERQYDGR